MNYLLSLNTAPLASPQSALALRAAGALLKQGHTLLGIFFQQEAVYHGLSSYTPSDEIDMYQGWVSLAQKARIDLMLCSAASIRRGIFDDITAKEYQQIANIHAPFRLASLGEFLTLTQAADRVIAWGNVS